MKKNKGWLKKKAQSQVVVITFLCVIYPAFHLCKKSNSKAYQKNQQRT